MNLKHAKESGGIPKWFWVLLLFFGYDDVLRWMNVWYITYPLIMIVCLLGFSVAIG